MQLQNFNFNTHKIRAFADDKGEPCFIAKEVCSVLGLSKYRDAIATLEANEKGCPVVVDTAGGPQSMATVKESGLYHLIFQSRKPEAESFRRWVTHDVLPALRKTGMYAMEPLSPREEALKIARQLLDSEVQIQALTPFAEYGKAIMATDSVRSIEEVAKVIGAPCGKIKLFAFLREKQILCASQDSWNLPYQYYLTQEWFTVVETDWDQQHRNGRVEQKVSRQTMVTAKGEAKIIALWNKHNPKPEPKK